MRPLLFMLCLFSLLWFFVCFCVSSRQRKDWTMNASSVVSHSTHQQSFNATWLSTALRAWEEPSSVLSALQVCIVHEFKCMRVCVCPGFATQWSDRKVRKAELVFVYMLTFTETFIFSIHKALHLFFSVKKKMGSKWVGKGQARRSAKAESSLLHVAFYLVK